MKDAWLGFVLVILGSGIVGYIFGEAGFSLGLLGLMGYAMALVGTVLLNRGKKETIGKDDG